MGCCICSALGKGFMYKHLTTSVYFHWVSLTHIQHTTEECTHPERKRFKYIHKETDVSIILTQPIKDFISRNFFCVCMYAYMYIFYFILLITTKYHHEYVVIGEWERPLFCEINVPVNDCLPKCKCTRWCMQKKNMPGYFICTGISLRLRASPWCWLWCLYVICG